MPLPEENLPGWMRDAGPARDVVLSSRVRLARNLRGFVYPHHASLECLEAVDRCLAAAFRDRGDWQVLRDLSRQQRDALIHQRVISPEFRIDRPSRRLVLDRDRSLSIMVNEEDHVRVQAITPGWSPDAADERAREAEEFLDARVGFARHPEFEFLTACPANSGSGSRTSALFHFIGLAYNQKLRPVLRAVVDAGGIVRGPYGEHSRAIAHYFQVSTIEPFGPAFRGLGEFLIQEERKARALTPLSELQEMSQQAIRFAVTSRSLSYADSLRVLAWVRWLAAQEPTPQVNPIVVDWWFAGLLLHARSRNQEAQRERAGLLREHLEPLLVH